eukprot:jgi/Tetstr1/460595/TSEL_000520.t1
MRLAGRCCSTRPTVLLTTSALATVLAAALMRRRPPATDEMACTRVKSGPIFAGGGETFSVVVDNPPAEHWEGALASPALAVSLDDPAVLVASNDRCHSPDTQVHRSQDGGRSWAQVAEMKNQYWSSLFFHRGALYMLGTSKEYGDVHIRRSDDLGTTWTSPTDDYSGKLSEGEKWHCAPMPVVSHNGRLWRCFEEFPSGSWALSFKAVVWSAAEDSDLLARSSWTVSDRLTYPYMNPLTGMGWLEGNMCVDHKNDKVVALLRVHGLADGKAAIVNLSHLGDISFPGGAKKFLIRYDTESKRYVAIANVLVVGGRLRLALNPIQVCKQQGMRRRNAVGLLSSTDLLNWRVNKVLIYNRSPTIGFQYADFAISGDDILAVFRTALKTKTHEPAHAMAACMMTFHRVTGFRDYLNDTLSYGDHIEPTPIAEPGA